MLDYRFVTASGHASRALPQRPVGLDMNLSQPNVSLVSPKKINFPFGLSLFLSNFKLLSYLKIWRIRWPIRKQYSHFVNYNWPPTKFLYFGTCAIFTSAISYIESADPKQNANSFTVYLVCKKALDKVLFNVLITKLVRSRLYYILSELFPCGRQ